MNNRTRFAATMVAGWISVSAVPGAIAAPVTLNFDDIASSTSPDVDTAVPDNYGGFTWDFGTSGFVAGTLSNNVFKGVYGNTYGSTSGQHALMYNDQFSISRGQKFQINNVFATAFAQQDKIEPTQSADTLTFIGVNNGVRKQLVFSLTGTGYTSIDLSSLGLVDQLIFLPSGSQGGKYFLFDDLTFDTAAAAPVPVPAAVWLLGSGMGLMFAGRRRKAA